MTRTNYRNNRIAIVLGLIILLLAVGVHRAFAAEGQVMPDLQEDDGTLSVKVVYTDEDVQTNIDGVELTIFKVADLSVKNGNARYTLTEDFSNVDVDFNGMTTEESIKAAQLFAAEAKAKGLEGRKAVSADGSADFGFVSHGAYVVIQTGATGQAEKYEALKPYLVLAPQPLVDIGVNDWEYDVLSIPKMVQGIYKPETPPPSEEVVSDGEEVTEGNKVRDDSKVKDAEKVKEEKSEKLRSAYTGDDTMLIIPILVIALAGAVLIYIRRRRNNA